MTTAPIGILGGTFDPIHFGHLRLAQEAADALRLAEVRFVPSGTPPHRAAPSVSAADRLAMVQLAVAGNPLFRVDECEIGKTDLGYTVDTLTLLREEAGGQQPLVLLMGADAFLDLATWSRWHQLFELTHIAVAYRPGFPVDTWQSRMPQPLAAEYQTRLMQQPLAVHLAPAGGIVVVPIPALDISATLLRETIRRGASVRYLTPDSICQYIQDHKLYTGD
ncbi:MAG: nicotinate-nucleotide adenylyltransferase [Betaproteobacteria bacterium]|nr:nicotinate-nucleotide adenylyltransferase [Betaproteobacteria bacterium]